MNELIIPPAPLWYRNQVVACAPDNTLVYGSKCDIVVVKDRGDGVPAEIKFIQAAHSKYITSISFNRKWKNPNSFLVSLGEEGVLKVWNLETFEKKTFTKIHADHKHTAIGAVFAGDDRVVSASSDGFVIVWNINTNEIRQLNDLFKDKVTVTCLSSCPHAGWLIAFGLSNGSVVIADLRRNGQVLYRLRGHYQSVVSLSWCPAPVNIFPRHVQNVVKNKALETADQDNEQGQSETASASKPNPWVNLTHADDDEVLQEKPDPPIHSIDNFLQECDELRAKIMNLEISPKVNNSSQEGSSEVEGSSSNNDGREHSNDESEEKGMEEIRECKLDSNRPIPQYFDPSGDFLDDSVESSTTREIIEDKDVGSEKIKDETAEQSEITEKTEVVEEEPRIEYLLASSAKDKNVYIWRAGTDGRMQTLFQIPKRGRNRDAKTTNNWNTVCWITPETLLTTSCIGEVLAWSLPKPKESNRLYKVIHHEHSSVIFNVVTPLHYFTAYNWRDKVNTTVWSWGHDGRLINYDMNTEKILFSCYTITASVTSFDVSSLDPNRLAIGIRDGSVRVWDLSLPHNKIVTMQKFQQKIIQKVSTIAWNSLKEMILGFGTEEGRVGFIDTVSKKSTLLTHYFHGQVHKVEWGPIKGDANDLGLYAVAEGKIVIYEIERPLDDPILLELPDKLYVYTFAWKPNFKLLLINGKDGSLHILKTDLVALTTVYLYDKGFNAIVWHPNAFTDKIEVSLRCNWFAATTSKGLLVYDCTKHTNNEPTTENSMENVVVRFEGHLKPTISLAWCPFVGNRIVSTAEDGLAHVWDVDTKSAIATFVDSYFSRNPSIIWSPIDADLVIIGGEKMIRIWSISKYPPKVDEEFMTSRKRLLAKSSKADGEKVDKSKIKIDIPRSTSYPKDCIVPSFYVSSEENMAAQIANMRKVMMKKEDNIAIESDGHKLNALQLFAEKEEVSQLLATNYEQQKRDGKHKRCELISLWKGNIGEYIKDAIDENRVTPAIITLAPMASLKLWQDACESYARKLSESAESNPLEAATYFLTCHKVEEAVNCLCEGAMFKEALALAKHRFPEDSEISVMVTEKWAKHCINNGNFETSAFCYISLKQYEKAAKVLARRNNKEFLEFAAELAKKAGNKELYNSIKFKCDEREKEICSNDDIVDASLPSRADAVLNSSVVENSGDHENGAKSDTEKEACETSTLETTKCVVDNANVE